MEITKIIGVGLIGAILSVFVKQQRPELGICLAASTGAAVLLMLVPYISELADNIRELCADCGFDTEYTGALLKTMGIAYISQYSAELAKDAGEGATAKKIEFAGKIFILASVMPVISKLLKTVTDTISNI